MNVDIDMGRPAKRSPLKVSSGYYDSRNHPGLDIPMPVGTPIIAVQDGYVITSDPEPTGDTGKWVAVQHRHGWISRYLHMSRVDVKKGQFVTKGQQLGLSGNTGNSAAPHLHFDLKVDPSLVPAIETQVGRPASGYVPRNGGREGIPAEPWIPVDDYASDVIASAKRNRIPLYIERIEAKHVAEAASRGQFPVAAVAGVAVLGIGIGAFFWLSSF